MKKSNNSNEIYNESSFFDRLKKEQNIIFSKKAKKQLLEILGNTTLKNEYLSKLLFDFVRFKDIKVSDATKTKTFSYINKSNLPRNIKSKFNKIKEKGITMLRYAQNNTKQGKIKNNKNMRSIFIIYKENDEINIFSVFEENNDGKANERIYIKEIERVINQLDV